jgi:hypothetical protein
VRLVIHVLDLLPPAGEAFLPEADLVVTGAHGEDVAGE